MNEAANVLALFGGVPRTNQREMIARGEINQAIKHVYDLIGTVNINFGSQDELEGINIHETWGVALHFLFQQWEMLQGEVLSSPLSRDDMIEDFNFAHRGFGEAEP